MVNFHMFFVVFKIASSYIYYDTGLARNFDNTYDSTFIC